MTADKKLISPIAPVPYGDRFIEFIEGITQSPEEAARSAHNAIGSSIPHTNSNPVSNRNTTSMESPRRSEMQQVHRNGSTNTTILRAEQEALRQEKKGEDEAHRPEPRRIMAVRSPSAERSGGLQGQILPIVEEIGEASSTGGRSTKSREGNENHDGDRRPLTPAKDHNDGRPLTPAKDHGANTNGSMRKISRTSLDKDLPPLPPALNPMEMSGRGVVRS